MPPLSPPQPALEQLARAPAAAKAPPRAAFAQVLAAALAPKTPPPRPSTELLPRAKRGEPERCDERERDRPAEQAGEPSREGEVELREAGEGIGDRRGEDLLDPSFRHAASLAPPQSVAQATSPSEVEAGTARARLSLEELLPALVRRVAWAGDRHRGSVRLELGAGAYAGATLLVHADHGRVRVEVSGPGADELRRRIDERLRRHGLDVESVT